LLFNGWRISCRGGEIIHSFLVHEIASLSSNSLLCFDRLRVIKYLVGVVRLFARSSLMRSLRLVRTHSSVLTG
jgi:hypothetical protein